MYGVTSATTWAGKLGGRCWVPAWNIIIELVVVISGRVGDGEGGLG